MKANLPFGPLRTFESVARLRGFGRAAEELGVTQSAVSQQVKALEEWLGCQLITRAGRATPTDAGADLAAAVAAGFGRVASLCHDLRNAHSTAPAIGLSCLPGFAVNWLFPRLIHFDQRHPDIPVSILTTDAMANFTDDDVDLAIRYGVGSYAGLHVEKLMAERLFPVCAPGLLDRLPLNVVADLARHTLLYDDLADIGGTPPTWEYWARELGVTLPRPARTRRFGQSNMVVQAAISGFGVALGREPLVVDALADGRLVRPFADLVPSQFAYWLVCPTEAARSPRLAAICAWLHDEVARQPPITPASRVG
ncbi:LysR family transcriptional regulator, glycine cleavage system transcriptional activator [Pseudorhodobacter antarcticus]|jgi:LysR family glycine cleavage system transcriptional activator|uniref:LysR family transcriptional regulator, glycine cleavage system transcriptional activator n=1 Tax=Pseudorhodobacter antarcticus TaxID=1077947 RepID=A0A1H8MQ97_9RHOB|nr:LysR substrate-binding domain-containing protein [Pseudorhodobacter antarcticus]SEO19403.1 LysR family transcriptional regulator, glycine cleavage system transcriptional activator [Pseudorhodobacter antarcticus]